MSSTTRTKVGFRIPETDSSRFEDEDFKPAKRPIKKKGRGPSWYELKTKDFVDELRTAKSKQYLDEKSQRNGEPE